MNHWITWKFKRPDGRTENRVSLDHYVSGESPMAFCGRVVPDDHVVISKGDTPTRPCQVCATVARLRTGDTK